MAPQILSRRPFYKAVLYAGSQSIESPSLRALIDLYTADFFAKILPGIRTAKKLNKVDEFFKRNGFINRSLKVTPVPSIQGEKITCLDLKTKVRSQLATYAYHKSKNLAKYHLKEW